MSDNSITKELAMGSIMTGQISEIHLSNMRIYPFVFLDNITEAHISYDIITDSSNNIPGKRSTVSYAVSFVDGKIPETLRSGFDNLKKALSVLFSQDVVLILRNDQGQDLLDKT
jgi:hypothetical protein